MFCTLFSVAELWRCTAASLVCTRMGGMATDFRQPINPMRHIMATSTRKPCFDLNDPAFKDILDQAVKAALAARDAEDKGKAKESVHTKITQAFRKAGYKGEIV